jgi:hypothetical protein
MQNASKIPTNLLSCDDNDFDESCDVIWIKFDYLGFYLGYNTV